MKSVQKLLDLPIVSIAPSSMPLADISLTRLEPGEWLAILKNSEFVITNSFHGTVFAIKSEKRFVSVPLLIDRKKRICKMEEFIHKKGLQKHLSVIGFFPDNVPLENFSPKNARIENLLTKASLEERFFRNNKGFEFLLEDIDYVAVNQRLRKYIDESRKNLKDSLS